jgi:hypothetical protein
MQSMPMAVMMSTGQMLAMLLSVLAGLAGIVGFIVWGARHAYLERRRIRCPLGGRMARVLFQLGPDGARKDVVRCSLGPGDASLGCGKTCLAPPTIIGAR